MMALTCHLPPCKISWSLANAYQREGTILHSCILQSAVGTCKWISRCRWHSEDTVASKMQSRISNCMHKYVLMCAAPPIGMILESVFSSLGVLDRRCVWRFIASANNGGGVVWCINVKSHLHVEVDLQLDCHGTGGSTPDDCLDLQDATPSCHRLPIYKPKK